VTPREAINTERVASILERDASVTIHDWLARVERDDELTHIPLTSKQRTGHLPKLIQELVHRLRVPRSLGTKQVSEAAVEHGKVRRSQGYSIAMMVEESRILQVSIFQTLQNNLSTVDFSLLLIDVMTIADEVDSQLKQTIISFTESQRRLPPKTKIQSAKATLAAVIKEMEKPRMTESAREQSPMANDRLVVKNDADQRTVDVHSPAVVVDETQVPEAI
jgi:hypothetical protein